MQDELVEDGGIDWEKYDVVIEDAFLNLAYINACARFCQSRLGCSDKRKDNSDSARKYLIEDTIDMQRV